MSERLKVLVVKNGEVRELNNLSEETLLKLEQAYESAPIVGLSRKTYLSMADFFESNLKTYEQLAAADTENMYSRSIAFAKAFRINSDESPALFDMMLMVERSLNEHKSFSSKSICIRNMKSLIGKDWQDANRDFKRWSQRLFEDTGLKIGIIRMSKFYFGIISAIA